jgi:hypothetical protein
MGHEYAMSRVKDALEKSGGNHLKAQRLLAQWLEKDHSLLLGLVSRHMHSIITHALTHVALPPRKAPQPRKLSAKDYDTSDFGDAILTNMKGRDEDTGTFGHGTSRNVNPPGKASKQHVEAINKLVTAGRDKSKKK